MGDNLRANLDQLLPQGRQRPVLHAPGKRQPAKEIPEIVRQGEQLEPDLVVHEVVARQPCPLNRVLAFLDPLFRRAAPAVELHHTLIASAQIRYNETHAGKQLPLMPLHLGHHATSLIPALGLIEKLS